MRGLHINVLAVFFKTLYITKRDTMHLYYIHLTNEFLWYLHLYSKHIRGVLEQ